MKGVKDPWRVVDPIEPPPKPKRKAGRINLSEIDLDADLCVPGVFDFECAYGSVSLFGRSIDSASSALRALAACIADLVRSGHPLPPGIVVGQPTADGPPDPARPGAWLRTAEGFHTPAAIQFPGETYDRGMVRLIRWLNEGKRAKPDVMERHGVTTKMR